MTHPDHSRRPPTPAPWPVIMWAFVLFLFVIVLVLTGCANPPVSGRITHKQHSDRVVYYTHPCIAWTTDRTTVRSADGKTTYTKTSQRCIAWGTRENVIPASWELCLDGIDVEGARATGCLDVPEAVWHSYAEGDTYPRPTEPR